jgi:hypothetical protein
MCPVWQGVGSLISAALLAAGCGNPDHTGQNPVVTGVAVNRSDVTGVPDLRFTSGSVLFVPVDRAGGLAVAPFSLDAQQVSRLGVLVATIGQDGRFPIPGTGSYLVCLADVFADHSPGPPYSVVGCAEADLNGGAVTVSNGEGGVEVTGIHPPG